MATTVKTVETVVLVDDLTGKEIYEGSGWTLLGNSSDVVYHFQSLSNLLRALATKGTVVGMTDDDSVLHMAGLALSPSCECDEF